MKDGYLNKCKKCTKADVKARRFGEKREMVLAYDRSRGSRQQKTYLQEYRSANQNKYHAHSLVNSAVRRGVLIRQPCFCCGSLKVEAHHPDYSSPLDVIWLCSACHKQAHYYYKSA